jgi:hypothetical protein
MGFFLIGMLFVAHGFLDIQGFLAEQGFFAAQGFLAAQGLWTEQGFFAEQGLPSFANRTPSAGSAAKAIALKANKIITVIKIPNLFFILISFPLDLI